VSETKLLLASRHHTNEYGTTIICIYVHIVSILESRLPKFRDVVDSAEMFTAEYRWKD
jgi:hypothetical protein